MNPTIAPQSPPRGRPIPAVPPKPSQSCKCGYCGRPRHGERCEGCGAWVTLCAILALFCLALSAAAAPLLTPGVNPPPVASFSWDAVPTAASYRLYYGSGPGQYTNSFNFPTNFATIAIPGRGVKYYFVAVAVSTNGLESLPSTEVSYTAPAPLPAPGNMQQPIVITVQYKNSVQDFMWADGPSVQLDATQPAQLFRLQIANAPAPIVTPQIRSIRALPPLPGG